MNIRAIINGKEADWSIIRQWEIRREWKAVAKIRKFLGNQEFEHILTSGGYSLELKTQPERKEALVYLKLQMGHERILKMLHTELKLSGAFENILAKLSGNRRKLCAVELISDSGDANNLVNWYMERFEANDEASMLMAIADHYLFQTLPGNRQEIIEVTGGTPFASRFVANIGDSDGVITNRDPEYGSGMVANCKLDSGNILGGIVHEFKTENGGVHAKLQIEFPGLMPNYYIRKHQFHLVVEFSNWMKMAIDR